MSAQRSWKRTDRLACMSSCSLARRELLNCFVLSRATWPRCQRLRPAAHLERGVSPQGDRSHSRSAGSGAPGKDKSLLTSFAGIPTLAKRLVVQRPALPGVPVPLPVGLFSGYLCELVSQVTCYRRATYGPVPYRSLELPPVCRKLARGQGAYSVRRLWSARLVAGSHVLISPGRLRLPSQPNSYVY